MFEGIVFEACIILAFAAADTQVTYTKYFSDAQTWKNAIDTCEKGNGILARGDNSSNIGVWSDRPRLRTNWIYTNGCISKDNIIRISRSYSLTDNDVTSCFHNCLSSIGKAMLKYIALQDNTCKCIEGDGLVQNVNFTQSCTQTCSGSGSGISQPSNNMCGGQDKFSLYEIDYDGDVDVNQGYCGYGEDGNIGMQSCSRDGNYKCQCLETISDQNKTWNKAREECQKEGCELATSPEQSFTTRVWLGLRIMSQRLRVKDVNPNPEYVTVCYISNASRSISCEALYTFYCEYKNDTDTGKSSSNEDESTTTEENNGQDDSDFNGGSNTDGIGMPSSELQVLPIALSVSGACFAIAIVVILCICMRRKRRKTGKMDATKVQYSNGSRNGEEGGNQQMLNTGDDEGEYALPDQESNTQRKQEQQIEGKKTNAQKGGDSQYSYPYEQRIEFKQDREQYGENNTDLYNHTTTSAQQSGRSDSMGNYDGVKAFHAHGANDEDMYDKAGTGHVDQQTDSSTYDTMARDEGLYDKANEKPKQEIDDGMYSHVSTN